MKISKQQEYHAYKNNKYENSLHIPKHMGTISYGVVKEKYGEL
jgi:hypothetical protein